ncbi:MAG: hypothetical protein GWP14_06820 [Actinobacteria bacterium]|nr:hypothetical protein [Actinomycetota bacterium]
MIYTLALVVSLVFCAATNLLIKAGVRAIEAQQQAGTDLSILATVKATVCSPWIIAGVICGAVNLIAYVFALKKFPVSLAYPILISVGYVIIIGGAAVWFSEKLTAWQMVGVGIIMVGVWVVATGMAKTA